MEKTVALVSNEKARFMLKALAGCLLITLSAYIRVPAYPVPFTLQTLAISLLALTQTPKEAMASALLYLISATVGLPVLAGAVSNPLWFMGKCSGYCVAFPISAYLMAWMRTKIPAIFALVIGNLLILFLGFLGLIPFFGTYIALTKGALVFIPSSLLKALAALGIVRGKKWLSRI